MACGSPVQAVSAECQQKQGSVNREPFGGLGSPDLEGSDGHVELMPLLHVAQHHVIHASG